MDHHHYHHHDHDQYQHQMAITNNNPYNTIITTPSPRTTTVDSTTATTIIMDDEKKMMTATTTRPQEPRNCPRCNSSNTKFCYYNNYSLAQPRYLCKSCRRYWTEGGSLRNVPVGGGSRKNKKLPLLLPNTSTSSTSTKDLPDLNPPFVFTSPSSSSNPSKTHDNNNDLSLSFSSSMQDKRDQGHYGHFTDQAMTGGQNCLFPSPPMGMIQFRQEYNHDQNNKTNLGFSLDRKKEEIGNHDNFVVNGEGSNKMMFSYGDHDQHHHNHHHHHHHDQRHDDGSKKREGGSSNELWSGIILGGDSGGPTW